MLIIFIHFFFHFVASLSEKQYIETKHMEGGVFGWPNALLAQRNLWASIPLPIKFYKKNIQISQVIEPFIDDFIKNFSINDIINDMMDFGSDEEEEEDSENQEQSTLLKYNQIGFFKSLFHSKINVKYNGEEGEENDDWYKQCGPDYPNVEKLGSVFSIFEDLGCEKTDELIGQILCYGFVIVPLVVMWVIITLFYIFYCCGCCCCCRAKNRYNPGIVSIVFYAIIAACLIIALIFNIVASVYMFNIFNYVLSGDVFKDIDYSLEQATPSLKSLATDFQGNITDTLNTTTNIINENMDGIMGSITDLVETTINNFTELNDLFVDIKRADDDHLQPAITNREEFGTCNTIPEENLHKACAEFVDQLYEMFQGLPDDTIKQMIEAGEPIMGSVTDVGQTLDEMSIINDTKTMITDQLSVVTDSINDLNITSKVDELNISRFTNELKKYEDDVPLKKYHPIFKALCFLFPLFLLILTSLEIMAFWLKNCCSRCIVCYCCPRCICTFCLFLFGIFCTLCSFFLLIINLICDQGDDAADTVLKKLLNENRTVIIDKIPLGKMSDNMINDLNMAPIEIGKPKFIDGFINAKLNSKLTDFITIFKFFPIDTIGNTINQSFSDLRFDISKIKTMVQDAIDQIGGTDDFEFNEDDFPIKELRDSLSDLAKNEDLQNNMIKCCATTTCYDDFTKTANSYQSVLGQLEGIVGEAPDVVKKASKIMDDMPTAIPNTVSLLVKRLLTDVGSSVSTIFNSIEPSLSSADANWMISIFNIIRVKGCINLFGAAMAFSISAHLYIIGFAAMTILLCVRRKGMGKIVNEKSQTSYTYSYSEYSYSNNEPKGKNKKKKKKGRHASEDENTSGNGLVEFQDDNQINSDVEKRDIDVSEKISDEQSNYNNPYQHDDSDSIYQNNDDESTIQPSESFQPQVSENENESSVQTNDFSFNDDETTNKNETEDNSNDESQPAKISETEDNDNDESNNIGFHDDESSGNNSDIDDGDQQTYVY